MRRLYFLPALLLATLVHAQKAVAKPNPYATVDALARKLPDSSSTDVGKIARYVEDHFTTPTEKTRAIFVWIANNIQYDVVNMFALNFYEDSSEWVSKALKTRKGICANYASLFTAICNRTGIRSVVVEGYTKQRGFVGYIPHAWSAAVIDGNWYLFDPTWGSGYVDNGKFVRKMNEAYFKAIPANFIATHMPFDYLWQFLYYPVTTEDFFNGKTGLDKSKPYFSYPDSIRAYEAMTPVEQEKTAADRIEKNGVRNSPTADMIRHLRVDVENFRIQKENEHRQLENDRQNRMIDSFNMASRSYNEAVNQFNVYINYYNVQFKPARPDPEIRQMLDSADHELQAAKTVAAAIAPTPADTRVEKPLDQLKTQIGTLEPHVKEMQDWLTKYLGKSRLGRKSMFYKITWFGMPVN